MGLFIAIKIRKKHDRERQSEDKTVAYCKAQSENKTRQLHPVTHKVKQTRQ